MHMRFQMLLTVLLAAVALPTAAGASTQSELNSLWQGAWVLTRIETASDCSGRYTNNEVRGRRVVSKGDHRFAAGEIAQVHKVDLKRKRVDVLLDLDEPLLVARREGPFTLYDAAGCKVELQIELPRGVSSTSVDDLDEVITDVFEAHDSRVSAEASPNWNARLIEPLPEDYDETLAQYERWRVDQINAEIAAKVEWALDEATRIVDHLESNDEFLAGFAAGADRARPGRLDENCDRLISMRPSNSVEDAPDKKSRAFRNGYRDGQELVLFLELARRLPRCFLPLPF